MNVINEYYFVFSTVLTVIWIIFYSLEDKSNEESVDIVLSYISIPIVIILFGPIALLVLIILFIIVGIPTLILEKYREIK